MRELDTCDFCGDDAAGVYEVLPAEVDAADATRRLALCADCRETLSGVVSPLLDALDADAGASTPDSGPGRHGGAGDATISSSPPRPSIETSGDDAGPDASESQIEHPDAADAASSDGDAATPDADTESASEPDPDAESASEPDAGSASDSDAESTSDADTGSDADADAESAPDADADADAGSGAKPAGYRKLLRLLENREGSMPRMALHDLATNAYGMSDEAFETVVEAAVANGDLEETDGGLRTA